MSNIIIGITFWIVVAIIVLASLLFSYFKNLEFQKTIRLAIEKGMHFDAESIDILKRRKPVNAEHYYFYMSGIICFACGIGLLVLAHFIAKVEPESYFPVVGAGILIGIISIGLAIGGYVLGIREKKEDRGNK